MSSFCTPSSQARTACVPQAYSTIMTSPVSFDSQQTTAEDQSQMMDDCTVLVDGHVHLHRKFDLATVFDQAARNFRSRAGTFGFTGQFFGCLFMAESAGVNRFEELAGETGHSLGRWSIRSDAWGKSIVAICSGEPTLVLIAGRQIRTREGLEVLAIGCTQHFGEGDAFDVVVARTIAECSLCIVPWGFGKWTGHRGALVKKLMRSAAADKIYLGDNGGRLQWRRPPELFAIAEEQSIPVLPGSDPFPFARDAGRLGSYGFVLRGCIDPHNLGASILDLILKKRRQPAGYGRRAGVVGFVRNQFAIQMRNRLFQRR